MAHTKNSSARRSPQVDVGFNTECEIAPNVFPWTVTATQGHIASGSFVNVELEQCHKAFPGVFYLTMTAISPGGNGLHEDHDFCAPISMDNLDALISMLAAVRDRARAEGYA